MVVSRREGVGAFPAPFSFTSEENTPSFCLIAERSPRTFSEHRLASSPLSWQGHLCVKAMSDASEVVLAHISVYEQMSQVASTGSISND